MQSIRITPLTLDAIETFVGGDVGTGAGGALVVATLQGPLPLRMGDWLIQADDGTFYTREG
ncbi:hypothetical protein SEA_EKKO14_21 [Microbacterium phage Ekko14]|nr:hypothetical protein SEA_HARPERANNE_21 [Microbacterium phage HarperAnne]QKY80459.1 hypothetical protein SEA_BULLZI2019_21 [Microbacterium phage Bullzi2019]QPX62326.1 hypothetical protein SEA_NAMSAHIR_22 [Microbacterium phage Namsahir]UTN93186.1 hypothetical protein SEA_PUBLIX_21 [Microbacterium phage Publix]